MFDNLLYQDAALQLEHDIAASRLPGALLLSGPAASGKLTCALELARVLSCHAKGEWTCTCPSCLQHKALVSTNMLLAGPRDCCLEISAAKKALLSAVAENSRHLTAVRYLFVRSVRKLTLRFSTVLLQDDDNLNKIAVLTSAINELLEEIDLPRQLPSLDELTQICDDLEKQCIKLSDGFMYDSIPIAQIRNASSWARLFSNKGKKVIIIENADRMLEGVRNALLKILEEPPEDTVFVLTTSRRGAVMPTILSRVRNYAFSARSEREQQDVLERVFHVHGFSGGSGRSSCIEQYLMTFLPVTPERIHAAAERFFADASSGKIPDVTAIVKECNNFDPRLVLKLFLIDLEESRRNLLLTAQGTAAMQALSEAVRSCWNDVTVYNQTPAAALDVLVRSLVVLCADL